MSDVLIALENIRTAVQSAASHLAAGVASRSSAVLDGNVAEVIAGLGKLDAFVAETTRSCCFGQHCNSGCS